MSLKIFRKKIANDVINLVCVEYFFLTGKRVFLTKQVMKIKNRGLWPDGRNWNFIIFRWKKYHLYKFCTFLDLKKIWVLPSLMRREHLLQIFFLACNAKKRSKRELKISFFMLEEKRKLLEKLQRAIHRERTQSSNIRVTRLE